MQPRFLIYLQRVFEEFVWKRRQIYEYVLDEKGYEKSAYLVMICWTHSAPAGFLSLYKSERLEAFWRQRRHESSWMMFVLHDGLRVMGYSFLHVPENTEWLDSLPTLAGEARECSSFVEPPYRRQGIRSALLDCQKRYCIDNSKRMWAVIEARNMASIASTESNSGRLTRHNYLFKIIGRNVVSIVTNPFQIFLLMIFRR